MRIDHYQILKSLGKGGMGEVFLAYDPQIRRQVAIKQIRQELKDHPIMKERFLREARVAAQLTHPAIIAIFSIHPDYYTMPYVEGETLKHILKQGGKHVLALTRIFLSVCEAIAYTHSKGIVHRDLKPDNIIVGKYGEVLLLDWGLADFIGKRENFVEEESGEADYRDLTRPGKVPGTLNYIAPERVRGEPSHATMDIYSLGVILYQLLTLKVPFPRTSVKNFRQTMHLEKMRDPLEIAPYRDIPQHLADIAKRCLHYSPDQRFQSVDEIIREVKNFLEGKPEWIPTAELYTTQKSDWEFQENVLLAKHTAITRSPDVMEWVGLMISQASFSGNTKVEAQVKIGKEGQGIGLLIAIPEALERQGLNEGYCVWMGRDCHLFQNNVEMMSALDVSIDDHNWHDIRLEKVDNHLFVFIDSKQVFHYISHLPMTGTHLGLFSRDADFEIAPLKVSVGSLNAMVNCLSIPDAFLANKNYAKALLEYRRIASSFIGRAESREALFRAGITLLQESSTKKKKEEKILLQNLALDEFTKLRSTPGAPLEYLGKSLVYKATQEIEEEIKCLELCIRKYSKHPMIDLIREHVTFRLHETSSRERTPAYHFALLALRHLPQIFQKLDHHRLLLSLKKFLEKLPIFLPAEPEEQHLACQLAFWLGKPITLVEMVETSSSDAVVANSLYGLLALGRREWVEENLHYLKDESEALLVRTALLYFEKGPSTALEVLSKRTPLPVSESERRCAYFLFERALLEQKSEEVLPYFKLFPHTVHLDALHVNACLLQNAWKEAQDLLEPYPVETLSDEYSPLFAPMGCFLQHEEGQKIAQSHFGGSIDLPYPPTTMLLSYFLSERIEEKKGWMAHALPWEKISLFLQLTIYFHCARKRDKQEHFLRRLKKLHE